MASTENNYHCLFNKTTKHTNPCFFLILLKDFFLQITLFWLHCCYILTIEYIFVSAYLVHKNICRSKGVIS